MGEIKNVRCLPAWDRDVATSRVVFASVGERCAGGRSAPVDTVGGHGVGFRWYYCLFWLCSGCSGLAWNEQTWAEERCARGGLQHAM